MNDVRLSRKHAGIIFILLIFFAVFPLVASADLYLNSRTGNIYLNTSGESRMQVAPGGNLLVLGQANVTFPANLTVDSGTLFVDSVNNYGGIGTSNPSYVFDAHKAVDGSAEFRINNALAASGGSTNEETVLIFGTDDPSLTVSQLVH